MTENGKRQVVVEFDDPMAGAEAGMRMSGLDYMRAIRDGTVPGPPIAATMNMRATEVEEGRVVFSGQPGEHHYNPIGSVHGGYHATLIDSAIGCAVHTTLPQGVGYGTQQLNVYYLRPVTKETGVLHCEATVVHRGRTIATAEAKLRDEDGKLYAHGTGTCAIFPLKG